MTKRYKIAYLILCMLSFICLFAPLGLVIYEMRDEAIVNKLGISSFILVVIFLTSLNIITKFCPQSRLYIFLLGLSYFLTDFLLVFRLFAILAIVDELIIMPLLRRYKNLYMINKEIDKRGS